MSDVSAAIERLYRRIMLVIGRGRIQTGKDSGAVQLQQVRLGQLETTDDIPRLAEYGFQSMPPTGSDAVVVYVGGNRTDGVIIATGNQQFRMRSLAPGEMSISDNLGQSIYLSQAGIVIQGANLPITINTAKSVTVNAGADVDINAAGNVNVNANNITATATGNASLSATGSVAISGGAGVSITTHGSATATINGSLSATASGSVSLTAATINLN